MGITFSAVSCPNYLPTFQIRCFGLSLDKIDNEWNIKVVLPKQVLRKFAPLKQIDLPVIWQTS